MRHWPWSVLLPLLLAYGATAWWCMERWNAPTQYFAHCWLVLPVAVLVCWRRRAAWRQVPAVPDARGFWLLGPALVLHLAGAALMIDSWSAMSLVLAVPGAAWLALGRPRLRGLWPVPWFVVCAVPLPMYVEGRVAFTLKEIAVQGGAAIAAATGAPMVRNGDLLVPPGQTGGLFVADACGGLRSLLAMLTLAYCLVFFFGSHSWLRRCVLLLAAPALAIAANTLRIAALCLLATHVDLPFAQGTGHELANAVEWVVLLAALLGLDALLGRRTGVASVPQPAAIATAGAVGAPVPGRWLLWALAPLLLALSLYRPGAMANDRGARLPARLGAWELVPRSAAQEQDFQRALPRWRELLGTGDFVWRSYRGASTQVHLVALFHDSNWKSVHPPRICIEGSNMDIETDDLQPAPWLGEQATVGRIVARHRIDGRRFVTLSLFGTADWTAGDYQAFTWHHLPRALLRASMSGFLLRAETRIEAGETVEVASARCSQFLQVLVPEAQGLLR